jgi:two-component system response regulator HydG
LIENGYAVLTASSVEEAVAIANSLSRIDVIVSEVIFSGQSGVHLAEHVDASDRNISTLLISHFHPDLLHNVAGFSQQPEFLQNPFTGEELLACIRRLLE